MPPNILRDGRSFLFSTATVVFFLTIHALPVQAQIAEGFNSAGGSSSSSNNDVHTGGVSAAVSSRNRPHFNGGYKAWSKALAAHAIIASLVWAFFIPLGGIILRLPFHTRSSPGRLRLHAILQTTSYVAYIAAVGIGIWLISNFRMRHYSMWSDIHPRLGLAIFALAFFQPILGYIHHRMYKKRAEEFKEGKSTEAPGRTGPGRMHLWLGRVLLILGILNGGLGIRMTGKMSFQHKYVTRQAAIGYAVGAGVMGSTYLVCFVLFEARKAKHDGDARRQKAIKLEMKQRGGDAGIGADVDVRDVRDVNDVNRYRLDTPPTYGESEDSLRKEPGPGRFGNDPSAYRQTTTVARYT